MHCVHPLPAFVTNYDVDTFVMPNVVANMTPYVDKFEINADQELRASKDKMPRLSKQMEDREEDKERMKKLHKPQTTTLLPPRRVL